MVEDPSDLGRREIGVGDESGLAADEVGVAVGLQSLAKVGRASVLPDDGVVDGETGLAVPDDGGLSLVGEAEARDVSLGHVGLFHRLSYDDRLRVPNLVRVVLDPSWLGEVLLESTLGYRHGSALVVEEDSPGAGGPLVDRQQILVPIVHA